MTEPNNHFWTTVEGFIDGLQGKRLADIFRFVSFIPGESYGLHEHLRMEINYVQKGQCKLQTEEKELTFREGEIMLILPHIHHRFEAGAKGTTLIQLEFQPEIMAQLFLPGLPEVSTPVIRIVDDLHIAGIIRQIIHELRGKETLYEYQVMLLYAELAVAFYRYLKEKFLPQVNHKTLEKAVNFLQQHYQDDLDLETLAKHVGVSDRYLRRLFARHLGESPVEYLNHLRIRQAGELLRNTDLTIKEISFRCGFHSPQYFTRIFKQLTGQTPTQVNKGSQ